MHEAQHHIWGLTSAFHGFQLAKDPVVSQNVCARLEVLWWLHVVFPPLPVTAGTLDTGGVSCSLLPSACSAQFSLSSGGGALDYKVFG